VAKHAARRARTQDLDVVDAVAAGEQAVYQRQDLRAGVSGAGSVAEVDQLVGGLLQPEPLGQCCGQQQPCVGDGVLVIEDDIDMVNDDV
jgi:hypothetical protein